MRIAFPVAGRRGPRGDWTGARPGGADHSTLTLAQALKTTGAEPVIFVHGDGPTVDYVEHLGLKAEVLDLLPVNKREKLTEAVAQEVRASAEGARVAVARHDVDIVHTNDASLHRTWGILKETVGFQHVWHERGLFQHPELSRQHLAAAEAVLTISQFVAARAPEAVADRVQVVDNPVHADTLYDREDAGKWLRSTFRLPADARVLTMVANGNPRKRWPLFFAAASAAAKADPSLYFICLGYTIKGEINDLMRKHFPGELRRRMVIAEYRYDAPRIIAGSDALVATAKNEPLGRTIVEAAILGTPILAAASGGHDELLRDVNPAYLVEAQTPGGFAEAFGRLPQLIASNDPAFAKRVSETFRARFAPERHVATIRGVYERMMGAGAAATSATSARPPEKPGATKRPNSPVDQKIRAHYNTDTPNVAYCLSGLRRLGVNPKDNRARKMLLAQGPRFISRQQRFLYACNALLPVDLFLDIGVNYGECLVALPLFSKTRVWGYEANPELQSCLARTLAYNDDLRHVDLRGLAVGDTPHQTISFYVDAAWTGKSSAVPQSGRSIREITAQTTTIDVEMADETPALLLIKLDIEGYEAHAIRGAAQTNRNVANVIYLMEFDDAFLERAGEDPAAFVGELTGLFTVQALTSDGIIPIGSYDDIPTGDAQGGGRHTDLILTRFTDGALKDRFETDICAVSPKDLQTRLFAT